MATVYDFQEKVYSNQALEWSKDFRLALCTESSVKILSLNQEPSNIETRIKLRHSYILAEKDALDIPQYDRIQHRALQNELSRDDLNLLSIDKIMNPFKYSLNTLPVTGFCAAAWSPLGADDVGRSILATLSFDCRLSLYTQGTTEFHWTKIADLTRIRHKATQPSTNYKTPEKFHAYRKWCNSQAVTAISWCPAKFIDEKEWSTYSILAAGTNAGDVVFWKVKLPCLSQEDCTVLSTNRDKPGKVLCMTWSETSGLLAVAHYNGALTVGQVNKDFGTIRWSVLETGEDLLKASCMCFCRTDKTGEDILIVNKEEYIYGYHIKVGDDGSIDIPSKTFTYGVRQMYATGICPLKNQTCLVASQDGVMELIKANIQPYGLQLKVSSFNDIQGNDQTVRYNGITVSPNEVFFAYIQRPPAGYDHLKEEFKRPTRLNLRKFNKVNPDGVFDILWNHSGNLMEVTDYMECYRQSLITNPCFTYRNAEDMSKREILLIRFALLSKSSQTKIKSSSKIQIGIEEMDPEDETKPIVKESLALSYKLLGIYFEQCVKSAATLDSLNDSDFRLLNVFLNFIDNNISSHIDPDCREKLRSLIPDTIDSTASQFECPVCSSSLTMKNLSWHCENKHQFGICCHTLKPCVDMDYRSCVSCQAVSLSLKELKEFPWLPDVAICVYCESFML